MSNQALEFIRTASTKASWQEKIILLEFVSGLRMPDIVASEFDLSPVMKNEYTRLLIERDSGKPIDLIIGKKPFLDFEVNIEDGVFIPRPETEELVENTLIRLPKDPQIIVEIGTGTGVISLALARKFKDARIFSTDISSRAVALAKRNAEHLGLSDAINFFEADLIHFSGSEILKGKVDLLISNPPYIPSSRIPHLDDEVRLYDPPLALDGMDDGCSVVRRILDLSIDYLSPDGLVSLEIDGLIEKPLNSYLSQSTLEFKKGVDIRGNLRFLYASLHENSFSIQ